MLEGRRLYLATSAVYILSRLVLGFLGVRYGADYLWQHFHDVDLLKERLGETLLYTHAFTPFINLIAGVVLKISETHQLAIYGALFLLLGLGFVNCLVYLFDVFGVRRRAIVAVVALFSLTPGFVYFENLFHYEFIAAALLAMAAVVFHRALCLRRLADWVVFFSIAALICYVRTTFHLVWLLALVALAVICDRRMWRKILLAAVAPTLLVVGLYAKNQVQFGFFGASSMVGFNLAYMTTRQMSEAERRQWVAEGRFHPIALVGLYSPTDAYAPWVDLNRKTGVPVLDRPYRTNGQPNYNHLSFVTTSRLRMADNRAYLSVRPGQYLSTVAKGYVDYFRPTSRWHPLDPKSSPHAANRQVIGTWENIYNNAVHGLFLRPFGLYLALLPFGLWASFGALIRLFKSRWQANPGDKLLVLLAFCSVFVPGLSCLVTIGELERYRFLVEGFIWVLVAAGLMQLPPIVPRRWRR